MVQNCRKLDIGTLIKISITDDGTVINLAAAIVKTIKLRKPSGVVVEKTAGFFTDGTDGIITYTTILSDLDAAGRWTIQAYIEMGTGKWHTDTAVFDVFPNVN